MNPSLRTPPQPSFGDPLPLWERGRGWLALSVLGMLAASVFARPALADREPGAGGQAAVAPAYVPVEAGAAGSPSDPSGRPSGRRGTRAPRLLGSDGWWPGMAGIALALAVAGGIAAVARRFAPSPPTGTVQVVGRVSLSPKHSVYMLRVGRRVLLVGAGPQGAPSLITELEDLPESPPAPRLEDDV
jgi:flagellar protein FliO/FliZ